MSGVFVCFASGLFLRGEVGAQFFDGTRLWGKAPDGAGELVWALNTTALWAFASLWFWCWLRSADQRDDFWVSQAAVSAAERDFFAILELGFFMASATDGQQSVVVVALQCFDFVVEMVDLGGVGFVAGLAAVVVSQQYAASNGLPDRRVQIVGVGSEAERLQILPTMAVIASPLVLVRDGEGMEPVFG